MKKSKLLTATALVASLVLLGACSGTKETSQTVSSTSSQSSSTSSSSSTVASSSSSDTTAVASGKMDIDAIANGDFSSIKGTWQNAAGATLVFNDQGLVSGDSSLSGRYTTDSGTLQTSVYSAAGSGYALVMVPAGVQIPDHYFADGSDPSDKNRDRLYGAQNILSVSQFDPFYYVSDSTTPIDWTQEITGVSLESGQVTIDYANQVLGDRAWTIIQDNYNRTENTPYSVLQGNDGSLYNVYQNGVILDMAGSLIHKP